MIPMQSSFLLRSPTFLCLCLALDDVRINHSLLQVLALFRWSDETRNVDLLRQDMGRQQAFFDNEQIL